MKNVSSSRFCNTVHTYILYGIVNEITGILVQIYHNLQQTLVFGKVRAGFINIC